MARSLVQTIGGATLSMTPTVYIDTTLVSSIATGSWTQTGKIVHFHTWNRDIARGVLTGAVTVLLDASMPLASSSHAQVYYGLFLWDVDYIDYPADYKEVMAFIHAGTRTVSVFFSRDATSNWGVDGANLHVSAADIGISGSYFAA
jgi:hypothetical protein